MRRAYELWYFFDGIYVCLHELSTHAFEKRPEKNGTIKALQETYIFR
jgi:hypothetical protein